MTQEQDNQPIKAEVTRPCRIKGKGYAVGDTPTLDQKDFYLLCGIGKVRKYDAERIKKEKAAKKALEDEQKEALKAAEEEEKKDKPSGKGGK